MTQQIKIFCGGKCAGRKTRIQKDLPATCGDQCPDCGYFLVKQHPKVSMRIQCKITKTPEYRKAYMA